MRVLKFKRAYFSDKECTEFLCYRFWGVNIDDSVFTCPTNISLSMGFIDYHLTESKDNNSIDIYEGDIIKRVDTEDTFLVIWEHDCYLAREIYDKWLKMNVFYRKRDSSLYLMTTFNLEIIGSIDQNPELLK